MKYTYLFCLLLFLSGCQKEEDVEGPLRSNHTLLVYLGGDNSLDAETYEKLNQLKKGWDSSLNANLLIYQDTPFKDSPRLIKMDSENSSGYVTLETYSPENSASPEVFHRVIETMETYCPAESYGLIVFSHASGWLPSHTLKSSSRSIIIDNDDEMELTDFASAIPDHLFRFIVFEACNMAGVEVAYELKDKAEYIMASSAPIVSPGFTPIYANNINSLSTFPYELEGFASSYYNHWNSISGDKRSATISVIQTSGLDELAQITKQIVASSSVSNVNIEALQQYDGVTTNPYYFFDFAQYFSSLTDEKTNVRLQSALDKCVVYKANTPSFATSNGVFPIIYHSGLTTYVQQETLPQLNNEYTKLKWYKKVFGQIENYN